MVADFDVQGDGVADLDFGRGGGDYQRKRIEDAIESALYAFKAAMAEGDMKVAKRAFKTAVSMCCMADYADDYNDKKG